MYVKIHMYTRPRIYMHTYTYRWKDDAEESHETIAALQETVSERDKRIASLEHKLAALATSHQEQASAISKQTQQLRESKYVRELERDPLQNTLQHALQHSCVNPSMFKSKTERQREGRERRRKKERGTERRRKEGKGRERETDREKGRERERKREKRGKGERKGKRESCKDRGRM